MFFFKPKVLLSEVGSSIISTMVMSFAGMIVGMAALDLVNMNRQTGMSARARVDFENFIQISKNAITFDQNCGDVLGNATYTGTTRTVNQFNIFGTNYRQPQSSIAPGLRLNSVQIIGAQPISGSPYPIRGQNNTVVNYHRYITNIELVPRRTGGMQLRPERIPATIYVNSQNNQVTYCATGAEHEECSQMGGVLVPPGGISAESTCDLRPAIGGCAEGGYYTKVDGLGCTAGNVYTPRPNTNPIVFDCACPGGFVAKEVLNYQVSKTAHMKQWVCLNCTGLVPVTAGVVETRAYDYTTDALDRDLACWAGREDPQDPDYLSECPCAPPNEGSTACRCHSGVEQDPNICNNPCVWDPNSCECINGTDGCICRPDMCVNLDVYPCGNDPNCYQP